MTRKKDGTQPLSIGMDALVRVQLTEFGWSMYEEYFSSSYRPKTPKGFLTLPFGQMMSIFGNQLSTLPYDENLSVFVDNEIIFDVPNSEIRRLTQKMEITRHEDNENARKKWEKRMLSFKAGDKVVKTLGLDKNIYTYVELVDHLGGKAHEIICDSGQISIVGFFDVDFAK